MEESTQISKDVLGSKAMCGQAGVSMAAPEMCETVRVKLKLQ
jgi:hypothetical protein